MSLLSDLEKINKRKGFFYFAVILGLIVTPSWFLFQIYPALFNEMAIFKLILVSIAISAPIAITLFPFLYRVAADLLINVKENREHEISILTATLALIETACIFYGPNVELYFSEMHQTKKAAVHLCRVMYGALLAMNILLTLIGSYIWYSEKKQFRKIQKRTEKERNQPADPTPPTQS